MSATLTSTLSVNQTRLLQSINTLSQIGVLPNGGIQRIAFSDVDIQARNLIRQWMQESGMEVRIDPAGNMIGRHLGKNPDLPALATGSHIDTVPNGGKYDGAYGLLAGLEVVRTLKEQQIQLEHSLEVIVFCDEESSMIGSKAMSGSANSEPNYYTPPNGIDIQTGLDRVGGNWLEISQAQRDRRDMAAFVELHVEQGPVLESVGKQIGIVEGIVGQQRYHITVKGTASHAGTTPMSMRKDALVAAAQIVLVVNELGNRPGQQVATVGWMEVYPNAANTIAGLVELKLDIRDLSASHLAELMTELRDRLEEIAANTGTAIQIEPRLHNEPALAALNIQDAIVKVCQDLSLSYNYLPSRASHDAQEMAKFTDMGMIFVPSQSGISHSETEYTSPEQCVQGANVLLHVLIQLDRQYMAVSN